MALTNESIINAYKIQNNIPIKTPLYTYAVWRNKGYQVKKGAVSKKIPMWKYAEFVNKKDENKMDSKCYMKTMYLFSPDQVEKIKA